ncbi:hypothetical protein B0H16DRAFT_1733705 [Mycena metata]|uniref:Uncharacterized protein n=1 Tax=Mycena metata TaxID=1033252 RepID=A0AAD7HXB3_9AGAR|nr:hypothetical protein B0H16DRAFT_1733705 [Mycena metata]
MSCGRLLTGEALKAPQDFCARFKLTRIRTLQKYFGLTMGFPPCPSVISRVKSRCGRRIGSGTGISAVICTTLIIRQFDSDTQPRALGPVEKPMCESGPDLSSARGQRLQTANLSLAQAFLTRPRFVAGRSRGRDSPLPRQDLRLSSSAQSSISSSASTQVVNPRSCPSARPVDWRGGISRRSGRGPPLLTSDPWTIGDRDSLAEAFHLDPGSNLSLAREQRPPAGRISSREESIFLHRNAVSLITARQSSSPIPACLHSSVAPSPTPCRLVVRPSHGTAPAPPHSPTPSPHRHPASTAFTRSHPGALVGLPRPPGDSHLLCAYPTCRTSLLPRSCLALSLTWPSSIPYHSASCGSALPLNSPVNQCDPKLRPSAIRPRLAGASTPFHRVQELRDAR